AAGRLRHSGMMRRARRTLSGPWVGRIGWATVRTPTRVELLAADGRPVPSSPSSHIPMRFIHRSACALTVCWMLIGAGRADSQTPSATSNTASPAPVTATVRRSVVGTLAEQLTRHYVDADTGAMIARHVRDRLAAGAYDTISSPGRFAEALTVDLRAV